MKKTQIVDAWANIWKQKVSFFSIVIIAAMAVMAYLGINFAAQAMSNNANRFYDATSFRDGEIVSTLLLSEDDLDAILKTEGVADAERVWQTSGALIKGDKKDGVAVVSLTERINTPLFISGRLPEREDECLVDWEIAEGLSLVEGDTVVLEGAKYLRRDTFTVCGIVKNAEHGTNRLNVPGERNMLVLPEVFDLDTLDGSMKAVIRYENTDGLDRFSSEYLDLTSAVTERIETLSETQTAERTEAVLGGYRLQVEEGREKLDDAKSQLDDARRQLDDGWAELEDYEKKAQDAKTELDDAKRQLDDAKPQLEEGRVQLEDGEIRLTEGREELAAARAKLLDGEAELAAARDQLADGRRQLDDGWAEYNENALKLEDVREQLTAAKAQLEEGEALLADGRKQLDEAREQLVEAKQILDDGEEQLADGERELLEARERLDEAQATAADGRRQLADGYKQIRSAEEEVREALRSSIETVLGSDIANRIDWARDRRTTDLDSPYVTATDFPITRNFSLDLSDSLAGNIASVLKSLTRSGVTEEELIAAAETTYGLVGLLPDNSLIRRLSEKIAEVYSGYNDQYELLASGAREWDKGHEEYLAGLDRLAQAESVYEEGYAQWKDARDQLDDGWRQYNEGVAQYEEGLRTLNEKSQEYEAGLEQYRAGLAQTEDGARALAEGYETLRQGEIDYAAGAARVEAGKAQIEEGWKQYDEGLAQYQDAYSQFVEKNAEYADALKQYEDGLAQYEAGKAEYEDGLKKLADGRAELEDGEEEYARGLAEYRKGAEELEDAERALAGLDSCRWLVLGVQGNASYLALNSSIGNVSDMGTTFSLIFIIVGALVIYATLGRIVEEQRRQVGATRALGFYKREIFAKYLSFGLGATILGVVLGTVAGYFFIQPIVTKSYGNFFTFDNSGKAFLTGVTILVVAGALTLATLAVWAACSDLLRSTATQLLQDKPPKAKQRAGILTRNLSLYGRLIVLNIKTDKKRVLVTLASVAGCCTLLVAGFTMRGGIINAIDRQFETVQRYDYSVTFSGEDIDETVPAAMKTVEETGARAITVRYGSQLFTANGKLNAGRLICGDLEELADYYDRQDPDTFERLPTEPDGVWISIKAAEMCELQEGDTIVMLDDAMRPFSVTVAGIANNYSGNYLMMSRESYESFFGTKPKDNALFVLTDKAEADTLERLLFSLEGVEQVEASTETFASIKEVASMLDLIVLLMTGIAGIMACFILLNLISMHVNQKKRELTIMRVNGFTVREVIAYITQETVVTNIIGIVIGLGLGMLLGYRMIRLMEGGTSYFVRSPQPLALLWAVLITAGFSIILNVIALRKVKYLKLTDVT